MKATLGSISHGTMLRSDLIPIFAATLEDLRETDDEDMPTTNDLDSLIQVAEDFDHDDISGANQESGEELFAELIDALDDLAPPYAMFGAHPGDGADYGFWPDMDTLMEDAEHDDSVVKIDARTGLPPAYVVEVNDHGNVTLYAVTLTEVWSVV